MAITNYAELQTAVGNWLQRSDLSALIPDFITNAEAELNRTLRLTGQIVRADLSVSGRWTDLTTLAAPLAEIKSVSVTTGGVRYPLEFRAVEATQDYYSSGTPVLYTRAGDELGVVPPPDGTYTLELVYWRKLPDLATNGTNSLLTLAPDLYLYRAVMEGAQYTHNMELMARIEPMYARALGQIIADDKGRQFGSTAPRMRIV